MALQSQFILTVTCLCTFAAPTPVPIFWDVNSQSSALYLICSFIITISKKILKHQSLSSGTFPLRPNKGANRGEGGCNFFCEHCLPDNTPRNALSELIFQRFLPFSQLKCSIRSRESSAVTVGNEVAKISAQCKTTPQKGTNKEINFV